MSQWTHVSGIIRVDSFGACIVQGSESSKTAIITDAIAAALEPTPSGSEGPIRFAVCRTQHNNSLSWGYVALWGDLRDFGPDDCNEIRGWFARTLAKLELSTQSQEIADALRVFSVRSAILCLEPEYHPVRILRWDSDKKEVVE